MPIAWTRKDPGDGVDVLVARKRRSPEVQHGPPRTPEILTEMDDAVAYLTILGKTGSWGYGHDTGERRVDKWGVEKPVVENRMFVPGVHHVDAETVMFAKRATKNKRIVITDEKPMITLYHREGPLTRAHLRVPIPAEGTVVMMSPEVEEAEDGTTVIPVDAVTAFPCDYCEEVFVHPGPRLRHISKHHMDEIRREIEEAPEPPPEPEPALTDA